MHIYKITNKINGKCYVGQTRRPINERKSEHFRKSTAKSVRYLRYAMGKYGKEAFIFEVLGEYDTIEALNSAEINFIQELNSLAPAGYNLRPGGNTKGAWAPESLELLSNSRKGQHNSVATEFKPGPRPETRGPSNPRFGVTPEWSKKVLCIETGVVYVSIRHAATDTGLMAKFTFIYVQELTQ